MILIEMRCPMPVMAIEGVVENGQIHLRDDVSLPENTRVYVIVTDLPVGPLAQIHSPRLAHPEQAGDFRKQIVEVAADAQL
jgi:hypothetical protein